MKTRLTLTIWLLSAVILCFSLFDRLFAKHEFRQRNRFEHFWNNFAADKTRSIPKDDREHRCFKRGAGVYVWDRNGEVA